MGLVKCPSDVHFRILPEVILGTFYLMFNEYAEVRRTTTFHYSFLFFILYSKESANHLSCFYMNHLNAVNASMTHFKDSRLSTPTGRTI